MSRTHTYRELLVWMALVLPALGSAQGLPIGRSTVTLPDPTRWEVRQIDGSGLSYSGDKSGDIPLDAKRLVLRTGAGTIKAVMVSRVTKSGVFGIHMSWANDCAAITQSDYLYKRDRATVTDVDCLVVGAVGNPQALYDADPDFKKKIGGAVPDGTGFYLLLFSHSIGSGGYAHTQMLLASDFKGLQGVNIDNPTLIPTPVIAWAAALANSNRAAITSLSGNWAVPSLVFAD